MVPKTTMIKVFIRYRPKGTSVIAWIKFSQCRRTDLGARPSVTSQLVLLVRVVWVDESAGRAPLVQQRQAAHLPSTGMS